MKNGNVPVVSKSLYITTSSFIITYRSRNVAWVPD